MFLVVALAIAGCGKDSSDPAPTHGSVDGVWTYTTPDKAIAVDFELKTVDGVLQILNATMKVVNTSGQAAAVLSGVDLPAIAEIRINANDAVIVLPYTITFDICVVGSTFSSISVSNVTYTYPWGQEKTLTNVTIQRK